MNIKLNYIRSKLSNKKIRILDIGCSNDYKYFKDISKEFVGVDIIDRKLNHKFIKQNLEDNCKLPLKSNYFDIILALDILEHLNNRHEIVNELKRLLKKSGKIIISLPNEFSYQPVWYHIKGINWISGNENGHKYFYDIKTSEEYIKKHFI